MLTVLVMGQGQSTGLLAPRHCSVGHTHGFFRFLSLPFGESWGRPEQEWGTPSSEGSSQLGGCRGCGHCIHLAIGPAGSAEYLSARQGVGDGGGWGCSRNKRYLSWGVPK